MAKIAVEITLSDYETWRKSFDGGKSWRAAAGMSNERVYRGTDDQNQLLIVTDATDVQMARDAINSPEIKARMQASGIVSSPIFRTME